jgi:hypothetical protein
MLVAEEIIAWWGYEAVPREALLGTGKSNYY